MQQGTLLMLPINSTIDVTRLIMGVAFAGVDSKRQVQEKELEMRLERFREEERTYRQEMREETRRLEISADRDVKLAVMQLAKHAFDRKMDFFVEAFREFVTSMAQHEMALQEREKELNMKQWTAGLTMPEKIQIRKSIEFIQIDLNNIRLMRFEITRDFNKRVEGLAPEIKNNFKAIS